LAFLNEFHYTDQDDGRTGQFVEVALDLQHPDDLRSYSVVLYSGVDGMPYDAVLLESFEVGDTLDVDRRLGEEEEEEDDDEEEEEEEEEFHHLLNPHDGLTFYHYEFPARGSSNSGGGNNGGVVGLEAGIPMVDSNGTETVTPAGLALVIDDELVLEFISYGGSFVAEGGPAMGMESFDVNVAEDSDTPVGSSLQLTGEGCTPQDFVWTAVEASQVDMIGGNPVGATPGELNVGQTIDCTIDTDLLNATAAAAAAEFAEAIRDDDDLIAADDDWLGENPVIIEGDRNRNKNAVIYSQGRGPTKPIINN